MPRKSNERLGTIIEEYDGKSQYF